MADDAPPGSRDYPEDDEFPGARETAADGTGRPEDTEPVSSSSSDSEDSDCEPSSRTLKRGGVVPSRGGGAMVISRQNNVTHLNFGTVNLEGSTSGVAVGHKTEYLDSVTVQQIIHSDVSAVPETGEAAILRCRGLPSSSESGSVASEVFPLRTGLVLRGRSEGSDRRDSCGTKGNIQPRKHLLGRKFETARWLIISLFSCLSIMAMITYTFICSCLNRRSDTESVTSSHNLSHSLVYPENPQSLHRSQSGENEALPTLHESEIIPRSAWVANPPKEYTPLGHPVEYVIISHTATMPCNNREECSMQVCIVQRFHVESRLWSDIGYNFLVGGDGNSYEGRGWEYVGAHAKGYNAVSIGISFIGTFTDVLPPPAQIRACKLLIKKGLSLGKISPNYKLIGHRQVSPTESPGEKLYEELQKWEHWSPEVL